MDTDYLQRVVGECLKKCLAEVAEKRPFDPIEYIAHWLYNYTVNVKYEEEKTAEAKQVEQEKSDFECEKKKREQMKEEAVRFAEIAAERKRQEEEQQKREAQAALASKLAPVEEKEEPPEDSAKIVEVTVESVPPSEAVAAEGDVPSESVVAAGDTETPAGEGAGTAEVTEEETAVAADEGGTGEEAGEATED